MDVKIVNFPQTKVAVLEHRGPPELKHKSIKRLIAWRMENRLPPDKHQSYGVHYNDPAVVPADTYRVDLCVSVDEDISENSYGVIIKTIPSCRCALARHLGSRENVTAAAYLYNEWLPMSGEKPGAFPIFFHYVNVGPDVREKDMITDVYLPLTDR